MPQYNIRGITVTFPYEAYDCQIKLMDSVIASLQGGQNGLVESPTGTGKTLCLLCATLAWREAFVARKQLSSLLQQTLQQTGKVPDASRKLLDSLTEAVSTIVNDVLDREPPRIYYASRTHSQLSQAVQELKNTVYRPNVCVLGSRDQLCVNDEVVKVPAGARTGLCRVKVQKKLCAYYAGKDAIKRVTAENQILDIEELVKFGVQHRACPYYGSKELQSKADIVFLPYNYLIDSHSRKAQNIDVANAIIIFDEAHNLESVCTEATSFELNTGDLTGTNAEIRICMDILAQNPAAAITPKDLSDLAGRLQKLATEIIKIPLQGDKNKTRESVQSGEFVYEMMDRAGINFDNSAEIIRLLEMVNEMLSQDPQAKKKAKYHSRTMESALRIVFRDLARVNKNILNKLCHSYKVCVIEDPWAATGGRTLNFWCFHSSIAMSDLIAPGVRSTILASGTLAPLSSFVHEMGIPFQNRLENPHVISKSQVFIGVVPKGPEGYRLSSSYENRSSQDYVKDMGNAIVQFCSVVPDGVLVFFPSYGVMQQCIDAWKKKGIWDNLAKTKAPIVEPKGKQEFSTEIARYYEKLRDKRLKGAVFFAVCRGKASEGLDFSDAKGRAVIICGIPYPAAKDPKVLLKKKFLDEQSGGSRYKTNANTLSGQEWYQQQASRAVNQAIGRVIRHRRDFGAILLCDDRFGLPYNVNQLSLWVRPYVNVFSSFADAQNKVKTFFSSIDEKTFATSNVQSVPGSAGVTGHYQLLKESSFSALVDPPKPAKSQVDVTQTAKDRAAVTYHKSGHSNHLTTEEKLRQSQQGNSRKRPFESDKHTLMEKDRPNVKNYLETVKSSLSAEDYKAFVASIKAYKSKTLGVQPLIGQVFALFAKSKENNIEVLLEGFAEYIPRKYQSTYSSRKSAFKAENKI